MPAWMTSLLRELVPLPMVVCDSTMTTSCPAIANARALASPITPAPTTTQSTLSIFPPQSFDKRLLRSSALVSNRQDNERNCLPMQAPPAARFFAAESGPPRENATLKGVGRSRFAYGKERADLLTGV
jgi:hypothetical protein